MPAIEYYISIGPLEEVECVVQYDYQPAERQKAYYPGCDEKIEIYGVKIKGAALSNVLEESLVGELQKDDSLLDMIHEAETEERGEE